jgi:hypothetical protein
MNKFLIGIVGLGTGAALMYWYTKQNQIPILTSAQRVDTLKAVLAYATKATESQLNEIAIKSVYVSDSEIFIIKKMLAKGEKPIYETSKDEQGFEMTTSAAKGLSNEASSLITMIYKYI